VSDVTREHPAAAVGSVAGRRPHGGVAQGDSRGAVRVIRPAARWPTLGVAELWAYRELLGFLVWRDVKVRYKQTVLGAAWAIIQPLMTMVVFTVFFGRLAGIPSDGVPYPLFAFAGLVPWTFFATGVAQSANSLVASSNLLRKVYFPRLLLPIESVAAGLVDFALSLAVLLGLMLAFGVRPSARIVLVVPLLALALVTAVGVGLWLSSLNVRYRDVRHTLPFVTQIWLFATPVAYPSTMVPDAWRLVYGLNPMVGVVDGFRWALLGTTTAPGAQVAVSSIVALVVLVTGAYYFRRAERSFADVV
jgi:lipopolysaccharide transport system permease protein